MSNFVLCWLHRCTHWREKQVQTQHEFITPAEKTQCQAHLTSEKVQGNLPQCSHTQESRVKNLAPTETVFPWHIEQFEEKMKHYPDSLNRKVIRDKFLKSKEITYSQRQDLKY